MSSAEITNALQRTKHQFPIKRKFLFEVVKSGPGLLDKLTAAVGPILVCVGYCVCYTVICCAVVLCVLVLVLCYAVV